MWRKDIILSGTQGTLFLVLSQRVPGCCGGSTRQLGCTEKHLEKFNGGSTFTVDNSVCSATPSRPPFHHALVLCVPFLKENRRHAAVVGKIPPNLELS